ncbi:MAG TPA: hypothetical protein VGD52_00905 [Pseudoduganella sp.]
MDLFAKFGVVLGGLLLSLIAGAVGTFLFIQMPCNWFGPVYGNGCGYEWLAKGVIAGVITAAIAFVVFLTWYFRRKAA